VPPNVSILFIDWTLTWRRFPSTVITTWLAAPVGRSLPHRLPDRWDVAGSYPARTNLTCYIHLLSRGELITLAQNPEYIPDAISMVYNSKRLLNASAFAVYGFQNGYKYIITRIPRYFDNIKETFMEKDNVSHPETSIVIET